MGDLMVEERSEFERLREEVAELRAWKARQEHVMARAVEAMARWHAEPVPPPGHRADAGLRFEPPENPTPEELRATEFANAAFGDRATAAAVTREVVDVLTGGLGCACGAFFAWEMGRDCERCGREAINLAAQLRPLPAMGAAEVPDPLRRVCGLPADAPVVEMGGGPPDLTAALPEMGAAAALVQALRDAGCRVGLHLTGAQEAEFAVELPERIEVTGCRDCPAAHRVHDDTNDSWCDVDPDKLDAHGMLTRTVEGGCVRPGAPPDWCPLRTRPVLVALVDHAPER